MRARETCVWVAGFVLFATVARADVLPDGGWSNAEAGNGMASGNWTGSSAGSESNGNSDWGWAGAEGWQSRITTQGGYCDWSCYLSVYAQARIRWYSGQYSAAQADAQASCSMGLPPARSASARVCGSHDGGYFEDDWDNGGGSVFYAGWNNFGPYTGPEATHLVVVATNVPIESGDLRSERDSHLF